MTKSRREKKRYQEGKRLGYISADYLLADADKGFLADGYDWHQMLEHCHKNKILWPGHIKEGDTVYLMRARPKKMRRKKYKGQFWKVQYLDSGNGFIQLANQDNFDKEGAEENAAFLRSHNFKITEIWNLDTAFTLFFLPRLKVFIESTRYGVPGNLYHQYLDTGHTSDEADKLAGKEWQNILIRMYEGLTLMVEGPDAEAIRARLKKENELTTQKQLWDIENKMEQDAQELFSKWFFNLWD